MWRYHNALHTLCSSAESQMEGLRIQTVWPTLDTAVHVLSPTDRQFPLTTNHFLQTLNFIHNLRGGRSERFPNYCCNGQIGLFWKTLITNLFCHRLYVWGLVAWSWWRTIPKRNCQREHTCMCKVCRNALVNLCKRYFRFWEVDKWYLRAFNLHSWLRHAL